MIEPTTVALGYSAVVALMSVIAVVLLYWDKRAARRGDWRVSERTLHTVELLGGWPGSWLIRRKIRHKTYKPSYRLVYAAIVLVHAGLGAAWLVWWF